MTIIDTINSWLDYIYALIKPVLESPLINLFHLSFVVPILLLASMGNPTTLKFLPNLAIGVAAFHAYLYYEKAVREHN
jgi:hypothetical protein